MTTIETLLRQAAVLFAKKRQNWALVGGLAVSARTEPRFTRDVDLALAVPDDRAAEEIVHDLRSAGFRAAAIVEHEEAHRLATVRLVPSGNTAQGLMLDLLFASSGIEMEVCNEAELLEVLPECVVPVARLHHLIALKVLSRDDRTRPQDAADLQHLITAATQSDLDAARDAVRLIETREFNRSHNLVDALANAMQEFGT